MLQVFSSREELIQWTRDVGKRNGLVIMIEKSDVTANGRKPRKIFTCEKSGVYRHRCPQGHKPKPIKATGTKKYKGPFKLKGQKMANNDD